MSADCSFFSDSKKTYSSEYKLYSPQPVKMNSYTASDANSSFLTLSPPFSNLNQQGSSLNFETNNFHLFSSNSSPCKKLFSSPEYTTQNNNATQPFFLDEINRLRADSMNQLENEINRFGKCMEITIDADLLLQQLDEDFANFPAGANVDEVSSI